MKKEVLRKTVAKTAGLLSILLFLMGCTTIVPFKYPPDTVAEKYVKIIGSGDVTVTIDGHTIGIGEIGIIHPGTYDVHFRATDRSKAGWATTYSQTQRIEFRAGQVRKASYSAGFNSLYFVMGNITNEYKVKSINKKVEKYLVSTNPELSSQGYLAEVKREQEEKRRAQQIALEKELAFVPIRFDGFYYSEWLDKNGRHEGTSFYRFSNDGLVYILSLRGDPYSRSRHTLVLNWYKEPSSKKDKKEYYIQDGVIYIAPPNPIPGRFVDSDLVLTFSSGTEETYKFAED